MIIVDNKIQVAKIRLAYIVTLTMGIFILVSPYLFNFTETENLISLIFGTGFLVTFLLLLFIRPQYVYFSIENNTKIVIRNYQAFPFFRKYKAYQFNVSNLEDYGLKSLIFNQIKLIRFMVTSKNKIGKYPWLYLSAVSKKEISALVNFLNKILPPEKRKKI
jgi:hypothetical protein